MPTQSEIDVEALKDAICENEECHKLVHNSDYEICYSCRKEQGDSQ